LSQGFRAPFDRSQRKNEVFHVDWTRHGCVVQNSSKRMWVFPVWITIIIPRTTNILFNTGKGIIETRRSSAAHGWNATCLRLFGVSIYTSHDIRQKGGHQVTMSLQKVHSYQDLISRGGNDIKDKHRCEAHRALRESRSVRRVWNFALEELGRININFDPAWMSGKKISYTVPSFSD